MKNERILRAAENKYNGLGLRRAAALLLAWIAWSCASAPPASGAVLGVTPWAVLRCQFSDQTLPPVPEAFYQDFFTATGAGRGGLYDYWSQVSMGTISLQGTRVLPWAPLSLTSVQDGSRGDNSMVRQARLQECVDATIAYAAAHRLPLDLTQFYGLFIIRNTIGGEFGAQWPVILDHHTNQQRLFGVALFDYSALTLTTAAHEMGHGYGLQHAEGTANTLWCGDKNPGVYCDYYDVMGAPYNGGIEFATPYFGAPGQWSGPGLNAQHLSYLGWIPQARLFVSEATQSGPTTVTLAAVGHPDASSYLALGVLAYDYTTTPYGTVGYTVEFRHGRGWDQAIPDSVLIHKGWSPNGFAETFLIDDHGGPEWFPGQTFTDVSTGVQITIDAFNLSADTATVTITQPSAPSMSGGGGGGGGLPPGYPGHPRPCTTCMQ